MNQSTNIERFRVKYLRKSIDIHYEGGIYDDGYKKILITMDRNPLSNLENGYQMMHLFDFLLNDQALETV